MESQQVNINQKEPSPYEGVLLLTGGIIIGLSLLAGIFFLIRYYKPKPPANLEQKPYAAQQAATPQPQSPTNTNVQVIPAATTAPTIAKVQQVLAQKVEVESCAITKATSSHVDKLNVFSNGISGTFRGVATKVTFTKEKQLADLELTSLDNKNVTTFNVQELNATLLRLTHSTIELSNDLHVGSPIIIGFKCSPRYENKFIITFIKTAAD